MSLKSLLEELWQRPGCINPCHINMWSSGRRGIFVGFYGDDKGNKVYCSKGRKVKL